MIPIIWPYKLGSSSAKALATCLETKRVRSDGNYHPRENHLVINWGNSQIPGWLAQEAIGGRRTNILNAIPPVRRASNKLDTLVMLDACGVAVPEYFYHRHWDSDGDVWAQAVFDSGKKIYCRTKLNGHSGDGIVIASSAEELVPALLYTVGLGWRQEFRVHVFRGEVIDYIKKCKMSSETLAERGIEPNSDIRSHQNGWVYARENIELPSGMGEQAILAVKSLGLDFGAVDCARTKDGTNYVLEVNTAPGLEGTTLQKYVEAIKKRIEREDV